MAVMPGRYVSERLVGRDRELSHLAVALDAATDGHSPRVMISGVGGIGVSRLVSETARRVAKLNEPFRFIRCVAVPARRSQAYAPIVGGLRPWLASLDDAELHRIVGPGAEPLARLLPELGPRLGDAMLRSRRAGVAPERRAAWVNEAIHGLLERSGERQPLLLALEDLHHADAGTRGLATFLARVTRPARLCLLVTYGTDRLARGHALLPDLASMTGAADPPDQLELAPLSRLELTQLVSEIEGERPTAAALLLVAERSGVGGNRGVHHRRHRIDHQGRLGGPPPVDRREARVGAVGNVLDAEPVVAELPEQLLGRVEDRCLAVCGPRSAPAASDR